jgi:glycosyltransferase involved in cell wall biosynthesis
MTTLSVVIPAYNEEKGIAEIANRVLAVEPKLKESGVDLELLIVDDGSKDRTAEIAEAIPGIKLIRHVKNRGYGGALKTGFNNAQGELIGFLDADGTYPPEYFPQLCQAAQQGADLVIGSRMAGAESKMPMTRRIGNFFFANLLTLIGRQRVTDSASGMRVFKKEAYEKMLPLPNGLNLTPVQSARAIHEDMKVVEVPIPYSERIGRSKLSVIHDGRVFLQSILWTVMMYNPVRVLGLIGIGGLGFTALSFFGLVAARIAGVTNLGPFGVAVVFWAMMSAVTGVSLFALGVTFNYMVSLFYKRPIRQGLFGKPLFRTPLDRQFWWMGLLSIGIGSLIGLGSLLLSFTGWEIARLWLYLLGSAMLFLIGVQLVIYWILLRVLDELSEREILARQDMGLT